MKLNGLKSIDFKQWNLEAAGSKQSIKRLFFVVSGYESRSTYWTQKVYESFSPSENNVWNSLGFTDQKDHLHRPSNDAFYNNKQIDIRDFPVDDDVGVGLYVRNVIEKAVKKHPNAQIEVHVDYSSMPRIWYCWLIGEIESVIRKTDRVYFWYSAGIYEGIEYPTAGFSDFSLFSGKPSLNPKNRTHIFGLGFDRIRASAIYRVLDPKNLVCFLADPGIRHDYVKRVHSDNRDLLAVARLVFTAPICDFNLAFGRICQITREFSFLGDVILVPDGPKPLVLAASLVPEFLCKAGIVSLHVRRKKTENSGSVNVAPAGEIYGLSVSGSL
jgi:hypothetical protein